MASGSRPQENVQRITSVGLRLGATRAPSGRVNFQAELQLNGPAGARENQLPRFTRPWYVHYLLSFQQLRAKIEDMRQHGYRLKNLNGYHDNGAKRYLTLFERGTPNSPDWEAMYDLSAEEYTSAVDRLRLLGFHLIKACGYEIDNRTYFAAIWERRTNPPDVITRVNMTNTTFSAVYDSLSRAGYKLADFNAYAVNNVDNYAAIWERGYGNNTQVAWNYTLTGLNSHCRSLGARGYSMKSVCGYTLNGTDKYAALFERVNRSGYMNWGYSHDQFVHQLDTIVAQQYTPTFVHAFPSYAFLWGSSPKYCMVWDT